MSTLCSWAQEALLNKAKAARVPRLKVTSFQTTTRDGGTSASLANWLSLSEAEATRTTTRVEWRLVEVVQAKRRVSVKVAVGQLSKASTRRAPPSCSAIVSSLREEVARQVLRWVAMPAITCLMALLNFQRPRMERPLPMEAVGLQLSWALPIHFWQCPKASRDAAVRRKASSRMPMRKQEPTLLEAHPTAFQLLRRAWAPAEVVVDTLEAAQPAISAMSITPWIYLRAEAADVPLRRDTQFATSKARPDPIHRVRKSVRWPTNYWKLRVEWRSAAPQISNRVLQDRLWLF